jgi:hypothetical protein
MLARLTPLLAAAALLFCAAPAVADQFDVNALGDPITPGTCTGGPPVWDCTSLRAAVTFSNNNDVEDQIFLQAPGTYHLNSALTLDANVMLAGLGARDTVIDGDGESQVLIVTANSTASIFNLTIQNGSNATGFGGNILNNGELSLLFTRITGGHAARGGGIASRQGTRLTILSSLIDDNDADLGGGIDVFGIGGADPDLSTLDVSDSTFARNFSPNAGGGMRIDGGVEATILHATIALNTGGGGIAITNGAQADVELYGSLLAGNLGTNCPSTAKPIDEQYNLDDATTCGLDDPSSKVNTDPGLDEDLRDRGGQTDVLPFLNAGSPAVDMVAFCGSATDQRGFARTNGGITQPCDAGAYEESAQGVPGPTIDTGPSGAIAGGTATFAFSTDDPSAKFVCRLSTGSSPGTFEECTSPKTYSGLGPGDYVFQVAIADPQSGQPASAVAFRQFSIGTPPQATPTATQTPAPTAVPAQAPTPVPQKDATGKPSGTVLIKQGGKFVPFDPSKPIPDGAEIDVKKGKIELTAVLTPGGKPQKATFYDGVFKLKLGKKTTDLTLSEPLAPCGKGKAGAAAKKPKTRKLWGDGSGSFRTRGQYSAATVRGTQWLVQDSCAGTLTQVKKGVVSVFDQVKKKTILLKAGKKYLAKPRR